MSTSATGDTLRNALDCRDSKRQNTVEDQAEVRFVNVVAYRRSDRSRVWQEPHSISLGQIVPFWISRRKNRCIGLGSRSGLGEKVAGGRFPALKAEAK